MANAKCGWCGATYGNAADMLDHIAKDHPAPGTNPQPYKGRKPPKDKKP